MAFENVRKEDLVDRGAPYRVLKDGTWAATVVDCGEHPGEKMLMCRVTVVVTPHKDNGASQGPIEIDAYLPAETINSQGKRQSLARLTSFLNACSVPINPNGGFDDKACIGKPVRVMTRWTKPRDTQYQDRAEVLDFLPPIVGQKAVQQYLRPTNDGATAGTPGNPF